MRQPLAGTGQFALQDKGGNLGGDADDVAGANPQAVVGLSTGKGEQRFNHIQPVHVVARLTATGETANVVSGIGFGADEITIEGENSTRLL